MTVEKVKRMMDACYLAKRIRDMLPKLPKGVLPSYIHYLDVIIELEKKGIQVKVSDISDTLKIPRPGVTKTVKEMEEKGYLKKQSSKEDGRITYITTTDKGQGLSDKYNDAYFGKLCEWLSGIPEADADCMIQTIETFYEVMQERREDFE